MSISIKGKKDIENMKIAGKKAAAVLKMLEENVVPGVTTKELDDIAFKFITEELKSIPANIGYNGYEKTLCTSINNVICHGIPDAQRKLKDGDIVNIDVTVLHDGWHGDTSRMFLLVKLPPMLKDLLI